MVVHPKVPEESLSLAEVRKILLGDKQFWTSNLRVTILMRAPEARERDVVLKRIYRMNEAQYRQYWIAKVFRQEAISGPKTVSSNETAMKLVESLPGSIAFVEAGQVARGVKVLKVDGRLPGEQGYPLQ